MGIFDDVVVNAKSAANVVSKKAGDFYDISKLKLSAASIRGELNKKFRAFGEAVYNGEPEAVTSDLRNQIDELKESLKEVNEMLNTAKNQTTCPVCSAPVTKGAQYCSACGAAIPTDVSFCKNCGTILQDDSNFCTNCGAPVNKQNVD